eukprot:g13360.t1
MFSSSALRGGRRGGRAGGGRGGGGRGRGGRRSRSPNYGPARAGQHRENVSPGTPVEVIQKQHQATGELTTGVVSRLLTNSGFHPRGIKVMLSGGVVGRVQTIPGVDEAAVLSASHVPAGSLSGSGYSSSRSSSSSSKSGDGDGGDDDGAMVGSIADVENGRLAASTAISTGRSRRRTTTVVGSEDAFAAAAAAPALARSARPVRTFRAERVQGRSWSLEGGEVVAGGRGARRFWGQRRAGVEILMAGGAGVGEEEEGGGGEELLMSRDERDAPCCV